MNLAVIFSIVVALAVIYVLFMQVIFGKIPLAAIDWVWIVPFAVLALIAAEVTKVHLHRRTKRKKTTLKAQLELA